MFVFNATDDQLYNLCKNAFDNSRPMGMGFLHFKPDSEFDKSWCEFTGKHLSMDYVQGRMVKIMIGKPDDKSGYDYRLYSQSKPDPEYQSWYHKFPTYQELFKASGIKEYREFDSISDIKKTYEEV